MLLYITRYSSLFPSPNMSHFTNHTLNPKKIASKNFWNAISQGQVPVSPLLVDTRMPLQALNVWPRTMSTLSIFCLTLNGLLLN